MSKAGDRFKIGHVRFCVVCGPDEYPIIRAVSDTDDSSDDDYESVASATDEFLTEPQCHETPCREDINVATHSDDEAPEAVQAMPKLWDDTPSLNEDASAFLWLEEFELRYTVEESEKKAYGKLLGDEVENYLRVHRKSRYAHKQNCDYYERVETLNIHRLEMKYLKDGFNALRESNEKDHQECVMRHQQEAQECARVPPPIKTVIGELAYAPDAQPRITPHPPVLREARRRHAAETELKRQMALKEGKKNPMSGTHVAPCVPHSATAYFPSVA